MTSTTHTQSAPATEPTVRLTLFIPFIIALFVRIPDSLIAFVGRFSIAAVFWKSGQTKIEGLAIDLIAKGPGALSIDHWIARRYHATV
jgi:putative oxidoreductase